MIINKGKDLSLNTVELKLAADPLSYVAFGALEYQIYDMGTRNSLSKEEVSLATLQPRTYLRLSF